MSPSYYETEIATVSRLTAVAAPLAGVVARDVRRLFTTGSGPEVARLFHGLLALVFLDAWISLGVQVRVLVGERGLLPWADFLAQVKALPASEAIPFHALPTIFWWGASDRVLSAGVLVGIALSLCALAGVLPRLSFALQVALYLSYITAGQTFFGFQWDNLLLECGVLAVLLPRRRRAWLIHLLFRLLLFKLYFESGIAKAESPLHDWWNGSAMTFYFETAPLPTWLALYAHALPAYWHHFESWATLALELVVPLVIFGPRRARLVAFVLLTGFQVVNAATANYGFFCYLAVALHVFLLDDEDIVRAALFVRRTLHLPERAIAPAPPERTPRLSRWIFTGQIVAFAIFCAISVTDGLWAFSGSDRLAAAIDPVRDLYEPFHLVNTYHLFASITRKRIEPEIETTHDGTHFVEHDFKHKPGALDRRPDFVAPHQPRVDFQLWFYGLGFQHQTPSYVVNLLDRVCRDPDAVKGLFARPLDPHPRAVRLVFWQYHFVTPSEHWKTGTWWQRQRVDESRPMPCDG